MNDFDPSRFKIVLAGWGQPALPYSVINYNLQKISKRKRRAASFCLFQDIFKGFTDGLNSAVCKGAIQLRGLEEG